MTLDNFIEKLKTDPRPLEKFSIAIENLFSGSDLKPAEKKEFLHKIADESVMSTEQMKGGAGFGMCSIGGLNCSVER